MNKNYIDVEITKEHIKALRIVFGCKSDLRVKAGINKNVLWNFVDEYAVYMFGLEVTRHKFTEDRVLNSHYENFIYCIINCFVNGTPTTYRLKY